MIKQLVGLLKPDSGSIRFEKKEVTTMNEAELTKLRKECGTVFQQATLFDSMSCIDNVALPIKKHQKLNTKDAREKAFKYLTDVGIQHLADRDPATLGPGLRKLVAIARTLTMEPKAILFDEPTTGLDPLAARKFDQLVKGPLAESEMTQIIVSHDVRSVFDVAQRVAMIHDRGIHFEGTTAELANCTDSVVRSFINGQPEEIL
jgi:phospholipid/cholesterol/gamma-HCH transport system ATP-binding protein